MSIERVNRRSTSHAPTHLEHETSPSGENKNEQISQRILAAIGDSYQVFKGFERRHQQNLLDRPYTYSARYDYREIPEFDSIWKRLESLSTDPDFSPTECLKTLVTWWQSTPEESESLISSAKEHFFSLLQRRLRLFKSVFSSAQAIEHSLPLYALISTTPILASTLSGAEIEMGKCLIARSEEVVPLMEKVDVPEQIRIASAVQDAIQRTQYYENTSSLQRAESSKDVSAALEEIIQRVEVSTCSQMVTYLLTESREQRDWLGRTEAMMQAAKNFRAVGEMTSSCIDVVSRDAIGCSDPSDGSILSIGFVDTTQLITKDVPSSSSIEIIAQGFEALKHDPLAMVDTYYLYQNYEDEIESYLSAEEREQFDESFGKGAEDIRRMCESLLRKFGYIPVSCSRVEHIVEGLEMRGSYSKNDITLLFQQLHKPEIRHAIEADLGLSLARLSLREQAQLLQVVCFSSKMRYKKFCSALRKYGEALAVCLLSCEESAHVAEHLLEIAEKLPSEQAERFFIHCSKSLRNAEKTAHQIEEEVFTGPKSIVTRKQVEDILFTQVVKTVDQVTQATLANHPVDEVIQSLERANPDLLLLAAVTKTSMKGKEKEEALTELKEVSLNSY